VYPSIIHSVPILFGRENSPAIVAVQMACAYVATSFMPPVVGLVAQYISPGLFPAYLLAFLAAMVLLHEGMLRKLGK